VHGADARPIRSQHSVHEMLDGEPVGAVLIRLRAGPGELNDVAIVTLPDTHTSFFVTLSRPR
jgi:hypothetical protein